MPAFPRWLRAWFNHVSDGDHTSRANCASRQETGICAGPGNVTQAIRARVGCTVCNLRSAVLFCRVRPIACATLAAVLPSNPSTKAARCTCCDRSSVTSRGTVVAAPWCSVSATSPVISSSGPATPSLKTRRRPREILRSAQNDKAAARDGDFTELFRLLGTSEAQRAVEGDGGPAPEYTGVENTVVEAVQARRPPATWSNIPSSTSN